MNDELLDFASKAKELGITEAAFRARVLNRSLLPYAYVSSENAEGSHDEFLPAWSRERFPWVRWTDHGAACDPYRSGRRELGSAEHGLPRYTITGWVVLGKGTVGQLLADKREVNLHGEWIGIRDELADEITVLQVYGKSVWVPEEDGGYQDTRGTQLSASDLYFMPEPEKSKPEQGMDRRREKSLLRIIRALDAMAHLPSRGAATAVEKQLQELGFSSPNDETVRKILEEARTLPTDKP